MVLLKLLASIGATLLVYGLYQAFRLVYAQFTSPLRDLPAPKSPSLFLGNFRQIWNADNSVVHEQWIQEYGLTFKYKGLLNIDRLFTMDTKAINYILMNNADYQKPGPARFNLSQMLGNGILVVEGEQHRQQRKIMNPAFGPSQLRSLMSIFFHKAYQLRDIWASEISKDGGERARIDVLSWLGKVTLDIIGLAGFNYHFDSLNPQGEPNELNQAFSTIFRADAQFTVFPLLQAMFPPLRWLPETSRQRVIRKAKDRMTRIGQQIVRDSKAAVVAASSEKQELHLADKDERDERDLLSLLIRANMDTQLPDSQRLSDDDVLAQVPTFLVAGHETTSTATTWALFALSLNSTVQSKLRKELWSMSTDTPTMEELNALPYLDAVVRETMRLHAPVPSTFRVAMKDDVVPLQTPFVDMKGVPQHSIRIRKGDTIFIPILAMNRAKSLWGEDAMDFRPERWESIPEAVSSIPGVWGNMLTFLGGPRSCIGYRFSLMEMKALLFVLVRAFEFELAVAPEDVIKKTAIVQRPLIRSAPDGGNQMPLWVRPCLVP